MLVLIVYILLSLISIVIVFGLYYAIYYVSMIGVFHLKRKGCSREISWLPFPFIHLLFGYILKTVNDNYLQRDSFDHLGNFTVLMGLTMFGYVALLMILKRISLDKHEKLSKWLIEFEGKE